MVINKEKFDLMGYYAGMHFYDWCEENKIKVSEPRNSKTKLYDKFIIILDTPIKKKLFKEKYPTL